MMSNHLVLALTGLAMCMSVVLSPVRAASAGDLRTVRTAAEAMTLWSKRDERVVDVTKHGVKGDGATDNGAALIALRDKLIAEDRTAHWHLVFPPGHYLTSNNRWIYGLMRVRLSGKSAKLQNISPLRHINDFNIFPRQGMFSRMGDMPSGGAPSGEKAEILVSGDRIETAEAGARSIVLTSPADARTYRPGQRVLVHGFIMMHKGYSPNLRYFEWHRIAAVEGSRIELEAPLEHRYNADWVDILYDTAGRRGAFEADAVSFGKPRVLLLDDRPQVAGRYFYPEMVVMEGFELLPNPYNELTKTLAIAARVVVYNDIRLTGSEVYTLVPRESQLTVIDGCDIANVIEFDKVAERVVVTGSRVRRMQAKQPHALKSGTGIEDIEISGNSIDGRVNVVALKRLRITGNSIDARHLPNAPRWGAVSFYNGQFGGESAEITGNTFALGSRQSARIEAMDIQRATIELPPEGSALVVARSFDGDGRDTPVPPIVRSLHAGKEVWLDRDPTVRGRVADIVDGGPGRFLIIFETPAIPKSVRVGDIVKWRTMDRVIMKDNVEAR